MKAQLILWILLAAPSTAVSRPCTDATPACTEWIVLGGGPSRSLVYRTYPLDVQNEAITRAFILVHGAGRDADHYFRTAVAAAFLAGALDNTIVVSPRFASSDPGCGDALAANEISWTCSGNSWRSGGVAATDSRLTSFDFADDILRKLARRGVFPNLRAIVMSGHSAGGQFVTRYEMANQVHDTLGVPITYIVANPSSYAYLDPARPKGDPAQFGSFADARNCTTYDEWPYGLNKRTGYAARLTDDQLKKQIAARPVTYLLGEIDILPLGGFDGSCPAMAQGPTRLARGQAFGKYMNEKYGAHHNVVVVPLCGHNARCMFTSDPALAVAFPKPSSQ